MDCVSTAREIMSRIRMSDGYTTRASIKFCGITYYDNPTGSEYFTLKLDNIELLIYEGEMTINLRHIRGIVYLNIYIWLEQLDRITK